MFAFFAATTPEGVAMMTDISQYLDFILKMFFAFGIAFEVPIATILLTITGFTSPDKLVQKRPYIIVGSFVAGMLLTPPDIVSQTLLAIPIWLLFEVGVIFARMMKKNDEEEEDDIEDDLAQQMSEEEMERELDDMDAAEELEEQYQEQNKEKKKDDDGFNKHEYEP